MTLNLNFKNIVLLVLRVLKFEVAGNKVILNQIQLLMLNVALVICTYYSTC